MPRFICGQALLRFLAFKSDSKPYSRRVEKSERKFLENKRVERPEYQSNYTTCKVLHTSKRRRLELIPVAGRGRTPPKTALLFGCNSSSRLQLPTQSPKLRPAFPPAVIQHATAAPRPLAQSIRRSGECLTGLQHLNRQETTQAMPYILTSQEWLAQSALLIEARPTTVRLLS